VAVIDQEWATVGSSNIDPLSLLLALEANVVVQDTNFAHTLSTEIISLIENGAQRVTTEDWARESKLKRFFSWIAYGVVRFFLGVIGYSNE
jgi:cardiolipin synthase